MNKILTRWNEKSVLPIIIFIFFLWPFYDLLWLFSPRGCNNPWPRLVQRTARFPFLGNLLILFQRSRNNEQLNLASHLVGRPDVKISKFTKCKRQKNPPMQRGCLCQATDVHFIVHASLTSCAQDKSQHLHPSIFIWFQKFSLKSLFKFCLHEKRCKWSIQKLLQRQSSPSSASQGTVWGAARNNWKKSGEEDTRTSAETRTETGHIADSMRSNRISQPQTRRQRQKIDATKVSSLRITEDRIGYVLWKQHL